MNKLTAFLYTTFGKGAYFIVFTICILFCLFPILMFDMNLVLTIVLTIVAYLILDKIPFCGELLWSVGLIGAITGTQDVFAIIYYIAYALIIGSTIIKIVKAYLYSNN